jgi:hypothetical protein
MRCQLGPVVGFWDSINVGHVLLSQSIVTFKERPYKPTMALLPLESKKPIYGQTDMLFSLYIHFTNFTQIKNNNSVLRSPSTKPTLAIGKQPSDTDKRGRVA